jgi:hypothetical protein
MGYALYAAGREALHSANLRRHALLRYILA